MDSVHLQNFPNSQDIPIIPALVADMDRVRDICSTALAIRDQQKLRVRLPLAKIRILGKNVESLDNYRQLIADELNVKEVILSNALEQYADLTLKINFRQIGERLGGKIPQLMQAVKTHAYQLSDNQETVTIAGEILTKGEFNLELIAKNLPNAVATKSNDMLVELDTHITPELMAEGITRDVIRLLQQDRKEAKLQITDRLTLLIHCQDPAIIQALRDNLAYLQEQTLVSDCQLQQTSDSALVSNYQYAYQHPYEATTINFLFSIA